MRPIIDNGHCWRRSYVSCRHQGNWFIRDVFVTLHKVSLNMYKLIARYLIFISGLYFLSLGVVLFVLSSLGTTPISSINYIISVNFPLTLGTATFIFNMVLILAQFWLIRGIGTRKDRMEILFQIPFSFLLAVFMDFNMRVFSWVHATDYVTALAVLVCGCIIQAVGVVLEIKPNVTAMSAEGVVKYASRRYNKDFGRTKVCFDITLITIAALLSLSLSGQIDGLREGTAIGALCTGYIVSFLSLHVINRASLLRVMGWATSLRHKISRGGAN